MRGMTGQPVVCVLRLQRYATTKETEAAELAWHFYGGMKLLNRITGIRVRSMLRAVGPEGGCGPTWWAFAGLDWAFRDFAQRNARWWWQMDQQHRPAGDAVCTAPA